jgi:histidyl-tRNA synthetase
MSISTSIPKGTRDFSPLEMMRRNYIFDSIREVFRMYAYQPLETPAMENLSTLLGKYGEEGDRLIFKILNSGDFLAGVDAADLSTQSPSKLAARICEKALRYDLTVPFARYIVQHKNEINFPFRRYQIQPVWRADRPQKGRYREFYQCDVDIIGTAALLCEVELMRIIDDVFNKLGILVNIHLNNRKILTGIAEVIGYPEKFMDITVAIDKLDKIGEDKVTEELLSKGIPADAVSNLWKIVRLNGSNQEKLEQLKSSLSGSAVALQGVEELQTVFEYLDECGLRSEVEFDISLARGLNYYTGAIFEVKAREVAMGSICGGGRYDDLTGIFGLPGVSGVGVSFGADRIYDVLNELKRFPSDTGAGATILFTNFGGAEERYTLKILDKLRKSGIRAEMYPEAVKMKKQLSYADNQHIPFVAMVGSEEMAGNKVSLKNMNNGEQMTVDVEELIKLLS